MRAKGNDFKTAFTDCDADCRLQCVLIDLVIEYIIMREQ